jgi:hypothetical protein
MSLTYQIQRKIRDSLIKNLRRIFNGNLKYPYIELLSGEYDWENTKVVISDILPQEHAFFPAIVVDTVASVETRYLGPEDLYEVKNSNHEVIEDRFFSSIDSIATINIYTIDDTISRDEIMDTIYDHFKLITDDLAANGIEIKKTTFNVDRRSFVDNRWYYTASITLDLYSEWEDIPAVGDLVESIPITITLGP